MYVRKLRKPSPNKNVFKFASVKNSAIVMCESSLEFDTCFHLEYDEQVTAFESQPKGFYYQFNGKYLPYTPDFLAYFRGKFKKYLEVKPHQKIYSEDFRLKFVAKKAMASKLGDELALITDKQIRINPILNNLKLLHRYCGISALSNLQTQLLKLISDLGVVRLNDLIRQYPIDQGKLKANVLAMISRGLVQADLSDNEFGLDSYVWVVK